MTEFQRELELQEMFHANRANFHKEIRRLINVYDYSFTDSTNVVVNHVEHKNEEYFFFVFEKYDILKDELIERVSPFYPISFKDGNHGHVIHIEDIKGDPLVNAVFELEGYYFKSTTKKEHLGMLDKFNNDLKKELLNKYKIRKGLIGINLDKDKKKAFIKSQTENVLPIIEGKIRVLLSRIEDIENGNF